MSPKGIIANAVTVTFLVCSAARTSVADQGPVQAAAFTEAVREARDIWRKYRSKSGNDGF